MNSQIIGIAGVFGLTFFLLALRHWFLSLGRPNRSVSVDPRPLMRDHKAHRNSADDNAWLLWSPEPDTQGGARKRSFDERRGNKAF